MGLYASGELAPEQWPTVLITEIQGHLRRLWRSASRELPVAGHRDSRSDRCAVALCVGDAGKLAADRNLEVLESRVQVADEQVYLVPRRQRGDGFDLRAPNAGLAGVDNVSA